ncbi:hypothetical protein MVEN_02341400 [Mycena venus]|uniref:Uncharacterized protein n=1 Tax=Mycena venus TaxID=2733690 RepID=A0A8H6X486_9AGAR|nr:hypothetical protein MVEN_02341400 [Mycena venus]
MNVEMWWTPEDQEWEDAAALVSNPCYRHAVHYLEGLVVKRLLDITKVNQSGLAYKMRSHIAKALQVRSKAIKNTLGRYNSTVTAMVPPCCTLSFAEVIDYTFLTDFDMLRDPEGNAMIWAWADPLARQILDSYYKIQQAKEGIQRLNIKICRFMTYMRDEKRFLLKQEAEIAVKDPDLP